MDATNFDSLEPRLPQFSKLSIAGLAVSVLGLLMFCAAIAIAIALGFSSQGQFVEPDSSIFLGMGILICGGGFVNMLGLGLSIGSLFVPQQSKVLSIVGIVLSVVVLCVVAAIVVFSLSAPA